MNHASLNTSALFGICICCGSSIYGLTVTRSSMVILWLVINQLDSAMVAVLNAHVFTAERRLLQFGVHLAFFL